MADNGTKENGMSEETRCADCHAPHEDERIRCRACGGTRTETLVVLASASVRLERPAEFPPEALS